MKTSADMLVEEAKKAKAGMRAPGYRDDKMLCGVQDTLTLLQAGADSASLNRKMEPDYIHEVVYKDHRFVSFSEQRVTDFERYTDPKQKFWV